MSKYVIEIFYSEGDGGYIAIAPELLGCSAFGKTEEEGREIPQPKGKELLHAVVSKR